MNHIALYRLWRPQIFQDVVGQRHIIQTLQNSLKEGRISHAYLFSGPRGTGKTSAAKIMAKAVNCEQGPTAEPCNECSNCKRITAGSVMDVIEIDAASNRGVEEIRDIRDKVKYAPTEVRYKVYIIDEVHMLTTEAFNALLKTLEEPPAHVIFILATTEPNRIPATIISRCQRFDFRRVAVEDQLARLNLICDEEGLTAESEALHYIARLSDGGMRDALSLLDQVISFSGSEITYAQVIAVTGGIDTDQFKELAEAMKDQDIGKALERIERFMSDGKSVDKCIESLIQYFRDLLMIKLVPNSQHMTERILDSAHFSKLSKEYENEQIFKIIDILNHYHVEMKYASQPQTLFEIAVMKICSLKTAPISSQDDNALQQLVDRVDELSKELSQLKQSGISTVSEGTNHQSAISSNTLQTSVKAAPKQIAPLTKKKSEAKWKPFLQGKEGSSYQEVCSKWSKVLSEVRTQKITVHAWLVDGEPVSVVEGAVLVAFKNEIHCKTTEKPTNKQLIEKIMSEVLGKSMALETVMQKDWLIVVSADSNEPEQPTEEFQLEPESESEQKGIHKEEWINEAIHLFGDDLVSIKED